MRREKDERRLRSGTKKILAPFFGVFFCLYHFALYRRTAKSVVQFYDTVPKKKKKSQRVTEAR